jgi:hypothetical protein
VVKVPKEDARRFLVARQLLAPARSLKGGPDAVLEVLRRLGSIQLDQVEVAGRNHDLVLNARVADYEPAWCDELYERREIFEAYNKGLSLVPASEFAWFRVRRSSRAQKVLVDNADVAKRVLERIRAEGPLSSLDFERETGPSKDWFGAPMNAVRAVLEAYAITGELATARRDGNHRYYDVPERLLPAEVLAHDLTLREQLRHKMLSLSRTRAARYDWARRGHLRISRAGEAGRDVPRSDRATRGTRRAGRARAGGRRGRERKALRRP